MYFELHLMYYELKFVGIRILRYEPVKRFHLWIHDKIINSNRHPKDDISQSIFVRYPTSGKYSRRHLNNKKWKWQMPINWANFLSCFRKSLRTYLPSPNYDGDDNDKNDKLDEVMKFIKNIILRFSASFLYFKFEILSELSMQPGWIKPPSKY